MSKYYCVVTFKNTWISSFEQAMRYLPLDRMPVFMSESDAIHYATHLSSSTVVYCIDAHENSLMQELIYKDEAEQREYYNYYIGSVDIENIDSVHVINQTKNLDFTYADLYKAIKPLYDFYDWELHYGNPGEIYYDCATSLYRALRSKVESNTNLLLQENIFSKENDDLMEHAAYSSAVNTRNLCVLYQKCKTLLLETQQTTFLARNATLACNPASTSVVPWFKEKKRLIEAYARLHSVNDKLPLIGDKYINMHGHINNFLRDIKELEQTGVNINADQYFDKNTGLIKTLLNAMTLVSTYIGEDGNLTGCTDNINSARYKYEIKKLKLQSNHSYAMEILSYSMLAIAIAAPMLAAAAIISAPTALSITCGSALFSYTMFKTAERSPGRRCQTAMNNIVQNPDKGLFEFNQHWETAANDTISVNNNQTK